MLKTSIIFMLGIGVLNLLHAQQTLYSNTFNSDFQRWEIKDTSIPEHNKNDSNHVGKTNPSERISTVLLRTEHDQPQLLKEKQQINKKNSVNRLLRVQRKIFGGEEQVSTSSSASNFE